MGVIEKGLFARDLDRVVEGLHGRLAEAANRRTPITAADLLNDRVISFYEDKGVPLQRVLTDRGTEFCGSHDRHEYELYLAMATAMCDAIDEHSEQWRKRDYLLGFGIGTQVLATCVLWEANLGAQFRLPQSGR